VGAGFAGSILAERLAEAAANRFCWSIGGPMLAAMPTITTMIGHPGA